MRDAIAIATEAGQGREAAVIYGNLGESLLVFDGAMEALEALEVMHAGIAFAQARGLTEIADFITGSTLDPLVASGGFDKALEVAAALAAR